MEGTADMSHPDAQQQMDAIRMMQQQPPQGAGGIPPQMMPSDANVMIAHQQAAAAAGMNPYWQQQQHFLPQQAMGQAGMHPANPKARLQCHACSKLLEYDAGAQYVQCFSCSTMNSVQQKSQVGGRVLSMLCAMCSTTNLAPYGINYVRCGTCHTISQVSHAYRVDMANPQRPYDHAAADTSLQQQQPPQQPSLQQQTGQQSQIDNPDQQQQITGEATTGTVTKLEQDQIQ